MDGYHGHDSDEDDEDTEEEDSDEDAFDDGEWINTLFSRNIPLQTNKITKNTVKGYIVKNAREALYHLKNLA